MLRNKSPGSKIFIRESHIEKKYTKKCILKNQIIPNLIPIETASISERSNFKASKKSSEIKLD